VIGLAPKHPIRFVACLGAHADDIEIGAAGTIVQIAAANADCRFVFIIATGDDTRIAEAQASATALLGDRVTVKAGAFADGFLPYDEPAAVKRFLRGSLDGFSADIAIVPGLSDRHQDHRFVAELAHQILRNTLVVQYEIVKSDADLARPGIYVPLSANEAEAKLDHLGAHFSSQHTKPWYDRQALQSILRLRGVECRAVERYAEAFHVDRCVVQW